MNNTPPRSIAPLVNRIFISVLFLFCVQILTFSEAHGQIVRYIHNAQKAEYNVFETSDSSLATYYVYRATNPTEALKEGVWYIVDDPFLYRDKAILLHRVKSTATADLIVYYVRNPKNAGKARRRGGR